MISPAAIRLTSCGSRALIRLGSAGSGLETGFDVGADDDDDDDMIGWLFSDFAG